MANSLRSVMLAVMVGMLSLSCGPTPGETDNTPPVIQLLPDMPGYRVVEAQAIQQYIAGLTEGAALLAGNPAMLVLIEKADQVIECYREIGAVEARIYSKEDNPLSSGAVAIADRNRLTDPSNLFQCVAARAVPFSAQPGLSPCGRTYTLERDDNVFYILYVGTTDEICQALCERLEGC